MPIPAQFSGRLSLPVIAAPMFLVSGPDLVIACCKAGVVGSFPSLNARPLSEYEAWMQRIAGALGEADAPYAVNLIVHRSNQRLAEDAALTVQYEAPVVITSVGHPGDIVDKVHGYGGLVFHDVTNMRHADKAIEAGVDGIILVCAGAGGHAGALSPFTLVPQLRERFDGPIILAGAISDGRAVRAAQVLGADLAYLGTRFIATQESLAERDYREMLVEAGSQDIVYTDQVSGIMGNFLRQSLEAAGVDWTPGAKKKAVDLGLGDGRRETGQKQSGQKQSGESKAWKTIWSAGQGVGQIGDVPTVAELVARLRRGYEAAVAEPLIGASRPAAG